MIYLLLESLRELVISMGPIHNLLLLLPLEIADECLQSWPPEALTVLDDNARFVLVVKNLCGLDEEWPCPSFGHGGQVEGAGFHIGLGVHYR